MLRRIKSAIGKSSLSASGGEATQKTRDPLGLARYRGILLVSLALLALVFVIVLAIGRFSIPFGDTIRILFSKIFPISQTWTNVQEATILTLRLPRAVVAIIAGGTLALSGATYQSIFKNPMVSPDLLGVSSGACVGAALAMLFGLGSAMIQVSAFAFGLAAVALTVTIPRLIRNESTIALVLSGIVVGSLMGSILTVIKYIADTSSQLAEITYWTMGSFATVEFVDLLPILPTIVIPTVIILLMRYRLNVLSLGDNEARTLGINLQTTRNAFIVCSTLITASIVCISGTIGWVGLIIPHVARMTIGPDNKKMLPIAMLFGGIFMLVIDTLCRTISSAELRLGILTGIIGAPFFIIILVKQKRQLR